MSQHDFGSLPDGLETYLNFRLNEEVDDLNDPGVGVLVIYQGHSKIKKNSGLKSLEDSTKITFDTPFYLASVAKPFTSQLIASLIKEGRLKPEDKAMDILPGLPEYMEGVQIKHLLNHSSGIADYYQYITWREPLIDNEYVLSLLSEREDSLLFQPGKQFDYSNSNFIILAEVAEKVSRKTYSELLNKRVFERIDMDHSFVFTGAENLESVATGYRYVNDEFLINDYQRIEFQKGVIGSYNLNTMGAGGIFATLPDLERWLIDFWNSKDINKISENAIPIETGQYDKIREVHYNYGWFIGKLNEELLFWHSGEFAGYRALVLYMPETEFGIIILSNNGKFNAEEFGLEMAKKLVELH